MRTFWRRSRSPCSCGGGCHRTSLSWRSRSRTSRVTWCTTWSTFGWHRGCRWTPFRGSCWVCRCSTTSRGCGSHRRFILGRGFTAGTGRNLGRRKSCSTTSSGSRRGRGRSHRGRWGCRRRRCRSSGSGCWWARTFCGTLFANRKARRSLLSTSTGSYGVQSVPDSGCSTRRATRGSRAALLTGSTSSPRSCPTGGACPSGRCNASSIPTSTSGSAGCRRGSA